jgi:arylsulfatase A-like enzyme
MISMDTTRPDHLSVYGYRRATSPHLERLASEGLRFDLAYAPTATTGPSHASVFTSRYPISHRVLKNGQVLAPEFVTLAELLSQNGWDTAAVVSSFVLNAKFGYDQGFAHYDDRLPDRDDDKPGNPWEGHEVDGRFWSNGEDATRRALKWLDARSNPELPFFLFVHYYDPHRPYTAPLSFQRPFPDDVRDRSPLERKIYRYDVALAYTDSEIGRLLEAFDERALSENTLVVVIGDHGEGLMQHETMHHGIHIYEEGVRIPLIMRWPGRISPARTLPHPVQLMDLAPTLLRMLGVDPAPLAYQGHDLAGQIEGSDNGDAEREIYLYRRHYTGGKVKASGGLEAVGEKYGLRVGNWKLIEGPEERTRELFDLASDPMERQNLAERDPVRSEAMLQRLRAWQQRYGREDADPGSASPEDRERLRALGYVD